MNKYVLYSLSPAGIEVLSGKYADQEELRSAYRIAHHRLLNESGTTIPITLVAVDTVDEAYYQLNGDAQLINIGNEEGRRLFTSTLADVAPFMENYLRDAMDESDIFDAVKSAVEDNFNAENFGRTVNRIIEDAVEELSSSLRNVEWEYPSDDLADVIASEAASTMVNR